MNYKKSFRYELLVWAVIDMLIAFGVLFVWKSENGIIFWIKDAIFTIFFMFGIIAIKDGIYSSDADILKKVTTGDRENFQSTQKMSPFVERLKIVNGKYSAVFAMIAIIFTILHFTDFYIPYKNVVEGMLIIMMIFFGLPGLILW